MGTTQNRYWSCIPRKPVDALPMETKPREPVPKEKRWEAALDSLSRRLQDQHAFHKQQQLTLVTLHEASIARLKMVTTKHENQITEDTLRVEELQTRIDELSKSVTYIAAITGKEDWVQFA